jgi:RNA polymerase sigma factor (sigma-70 family)
MNTTYSQSRPRARPGVTLPAAEPPGGLTDAEIVAGSVRDPDRFAELFARHWTDLRRFCASRAGSAGEDIAAEAFRTAFDRRHRYDPRFLDAKPWLFGIATNLLRDHFRAAEREDDKRTRSAALAPPPDGADEIGGLERQLLGPRLASALQEIPAVDRDALLLFAWADLDYLQIAHALGVPLGTVRSRIHRARRRLQTHLNTFEHDECE